MALVESVYAMGGYTMKDKATSQALQLISGFLRNRRKALGITQDELAELTGMGVATIRRFESGKSWINLKQYLILCQHLKCYPLISEIEGKKGFSRIMRERWELKINI